MRQNDKKSKRNITKVIVLYNSFVYVDLNIYSPYDYVILFNGVPLPLSS